MNNNNILLNESEFMMTITTEESEISFMLCGIGAAKIFWGDGSSIIFVFGENGSSKDFWGYYIENYTHNYSETTTHTITIIGTKISSLDCTNNGITSLNVSQNKNLKFLGCNLNKLKELDLSQNTRLWDLSCASNQIKELDLSNNIELSDINCNNNLMTATALNKLLESLHHNNVSGRYPYDEDNRTINISNNIGTKNHNQNLAIGWNIIALY